MLSSSYSSEITHSWQGRERGLPTARHLAVLDDAHARNRHLLMHGHEPSALMKSRRRIAFPNLGISAIFGFQLRLSEQEIATSAAMQSS
jgi:hypothetical protein